MSSDEAARTDTGDEGPKPVVEMDTLVAWFVATDAAERAKLARMPRKFRRGEGVETPLPD